MANVIGDGILGTFKGIGANSRTMQEKTMESLSIKDFGATGDGVTNDTAAFQAMADYAAAQTAIDRGTSIFIPPGHYIITNTISFTEVQKFRISGAGGTESIIFPFFDGDVFRFRHAPGSPNFQGYQFKDFQIKSNDPRISGAAINFEGNVATPGYGDGFADLLIEGLIFHSLHQALYLYKVGPVKISRCIFFNTLALSPITVPIVHYVMGIGMVIERCTQAIINAPPGVFGLSSGFCLDTGCDTVFIDNNEMAGGLEAGVHLRNTFLALAESGPRIVRVSNTSPEFCTGANFLIDDCTGAHFEGVHANAGSRGMFIRGGKGINVVNSSFNLHDLGGIVIEGNGAFPLRSVQISDCKINKNGAGWAGIDIGNNCPEDSTLISGCQIGNTDIWAGFVPQTYGVRLAANAHHINVVGNNLVGNPIPIQNDSTASTNSIANNILPDAEANRQRIFYPRDFGAKGDGGTDDTAALQRCLEAAATERSAVDLENGNYRVDTLNIPQGVAELRGPGSIADRAATSGFEALVTLGGGIESGGFIDQLVISNVFFFSDQSGTLAFIAGAHLERSTIEKCIFVKSGAIPPTFYGINLEAFSAAGSSAYVTIDNNQFILPATTGVLPIRLTGFLPVAFNDYFTAGITPFPAFAVRNITVSNNIISGGFAGVYTSASIACHILGNSILSATNTGIDLAVTCIEGIVSGNNISAGLYPIRLQYGSRLNEIKNNNIVSQNGTEFAGIALDTGSASNIVSGNNIQVLADYGIYISTGSVSNEVSGNYISSYKRGALAIESDWVNTTVPVGATYTTKIAGPPPIGTKWAFNGTSENVLKENLVASKSGGFAATMFSLTNIDSQNGVDSYPVGFTSILNNLLQPSAAAIDSVLFCFEDSPGTVNLNTMKSTKTFDAPTSKFTFNPTVLANFKIFEDNFPGQSLVTAFAANTPTPSVGSGGVYFSTTNGVPTGLTNFFDGYIYQNIIVQLDPNTFIEDSGAIVLSDPGRLVGDFDTYISFRKQVNGVWYEQWRTSPTANQFVFFADGDATPSVAANTRSSFNVTNTAPTTITNFDDGYDGQEIKVLFNTNTGITNNANIILNDNMSIPVGSLDARGFINFKRISAAWAEVSRSGLRFGSIAFAAGDTTPSVSRRMHPEVGFYNTTNAAPTSITTFDDGQEGQEILVRLDVFTTLVYNVAVMHLKGEVNVTAVDGNDFIRLRRLSGIWYELSRNF